MKATKQLKVSLNRVDLMFKAISIRFDEYFAIDFVPNIKKP
jgi:hypothetical protein